MYVIAMLVAVLVWVVVPIFLFLCGLCPVLRRNLLVTLRGALG